MNAGGEKYARPRASAKVTEPPRILRDETRVAEGKRKTVGAWPFKSRPASKPVLSRSTKIVGTSASVVEDAERRVSQEFLPRARVEHCI
jgi:hypothetical protein